MCRVTLMFGIFGGMDEEVKRKVEDSCFSQQQVCGHLSLNETVGRGFMANFGNLSPNTIRKCCYPSFLYSPTQCCLYHLSFSPHLCRMLLGFT